MDRPWLAVAVLAILSGESRRGEVVGGRGVEVRARTELLGLAGEDLRRKLGSSAK